MVNKRRNLQHTPLSDPLRILLCLYDKGSVISLLNLLEVSNPTPSSPGMVCTLRLIELEGRASPLLIDHNKQLVSSVITKYRDIDVILRAFKNCGDARGKCLQLQAFTAISPKRSMYQDICAC
ncbi:hypothetical protein MLD38_040084 [Melastoma candidum]|uniref:Uncharacterized protein n=1 Tax=Melastoma candidum TaxID=119954 RepID=A0ACB9L4Z8_9MYRT|nr:hypothetical protein MLD38_040084 [Melastoma candidum]